MKNKKIPQNQTVASKNVIKNAAFHLRPATTVIQSYGSLAETPYFSNTFVLLVEVFFSYRCYGPTIAFQ